MTTFTQYEEEKIAFFKKHNMNYIVHTSGLNNDSYHKEYIFEDGAVFYESSMKVEEVQIVEAHGLKTRVPVTYMKTEYWTSESGSKTFYENW